MKTKNFLKVLGVLIAVALLLAVLPQQAKADAPTPDTSWYKETDDSFTLADADDLAGLAQLVNDGNTFTGKTILLANDISLITYTNWTPIGTEAHPFKGTFDGAGKKITNLSFNGSTAVNVGLFGYVWPGTLKNVSIETVNITAKEAVGSLVGSMNGSIENVHVSGVTINSTHWAGGIVGYHYGDMSSCSAINATITLTFDTSISDNGDKAGGLIGYHGEGNYAINDCTAQNVSVTGVRDVGGLVGTAQAGNVFTNCHVIDSTVTASNATFVHSNPYAGGLIGRVANATVTLQYSSAVDVTVTSYVDGFAGNLVGGPAANWVNLPVMLVHDGTANFYSTIQAGINAASAGDTVNVAAGTYVENVVVNKAITLQGAGSDNTTIVATDGNATPLTFNTNGATVKGFHITHNYTQAELDAWNFNNNGVIFYQQKNGNTLSACKVTQNRNGIYINNAQNNIIQGNTIENNRTGINLTNYVDGTQIKDNVIQNNWTLGLVYYQGTAGLPTNFDTVTVTDNIFTDNWYSEILIKNTLASPVDTGTLDVTNNTFSDDPVTYTTSADAKWNEPGFADLKPVEFGGSATMPAKPLPTLRIYGVPGVTLRYDKKTLMVGADEPYITIQSAVNDASDGDTVLVAAGTYDEENILITKGITLQGAGATTTSIAPSVTTNNCTIVVRNPSGNVTIDGFNFVMKPKVNYGSAILVTGTNIDIDSVTVTISNNIITGSNDGSKSDYGFYGQGNNAKIIITGNTINKTGDNPIVMEQQFGSTTVEYNTFYITASPDYDAYYSMAYSGKTISTPQIVQNNIFHLDHSGSGFSQAISFTTAVLNAWGGQPNDTGHYTNIQIKNNTIYTEGPYARGIGLHDRSSALGNGTITGAVVTGNKIIGEAATDSETYGITLRGDIQGAIIQNNEISKVNLGFRVQKNLDSGTTLICPSNTDFSLNKVTSVTTAAQNSDCVDNVVDASPNWWGLASGPIPGTISGPVAVDPWCGDAECSFLNPNYLPSGVSAADIQAAINEAPAGAIIVIPAGMYNMNGGFTISNPGITIRLANSAIIQNDSPCFIVNADNVTITSETIGGAKCVPTSGWDGIVVNDGKNGVRILGLEIDGTTSGGTADGIHFSGATTDFQIVNNFIHNMGGNAVEFTVAPGGTVKDIQGNLFKNNGAVAIAVPAGLDPDLNAEYNSWGQMAAPTVTDVDTDPNTHVKVFVESSGTPWANQVVAGSTIKYTVKADLKNVTGAEITLLYPSGVSISGEVVKGNTFNSENVVTTETGKIVFSGFQTPQGDQPIAAVTGEGKVLFTVTFTVPTAGSYTLSFDLATDNFAMAPASGPSNYVYADSLTGATIKAIDLPSMTSSDIQGYYLVGDQQDFHVQVANPATGGVFGETIQYNFVIADALTTDIAMLKCNSQDVELTQNGNNVTGSSVLFPMPAGQSWNTPCTVKFNTAKSYEFTVSMVDTVPESDFTLVSYTNTAVVYTKPTITAPTLPGNHQGLMQTFTVNVDNMSHMVDPISGNDITFLLHFDGLPVNATVKIGDDSPVTCTSAGCDVPVTLVAGNNELSVEVVFPANFINGTVSISLYDSLAVPYRLLQSATFTGVNVYANIASVTGTVSMQGRTYRGGVLFTLAGDFGFGPYYATSVDALSNNVAFANLASGTYTITVTQARYLDVTADLGAQIDLSSTQTIAALELKAGDADDDNNIDVDDASIVGGQYKQPSPTNGDINFDGIVNIQDLALVGSNYDVTSAIAYAGWMGIPVPTP